MYFRLFGEIKIWDMKIAKLVALVKGKFTTGKISPDGDFITALNVFGFLHFFDCKNFSGHHF